VDPERLGALTRTGACWRLTCTRRLAHPQERVWRAITESEHLAVWFPQEIIGERRAGVPLRFVGAIGGDFGGEMLDFRPPRAMEFTWGADRMRIELHPDGAGTVLTLTDTFAQHGKAARDGAGWHECLDRLTSALDGVPPAAWGERWRAVHPDHVAHFGPGGSSIGTPPGWAASPGG